MSIIRISTSCTCARSAYEDGDQDGSQNESEGTRVKTQASFPDEGLIRAELERVLGSPDFAGSVRHRRFLCYIVDETLAGRADRLKAYNIATCAFDRGEGFDPQQDSIVRIEAGRLRRALDHFYLTEGRDHEIHIVVPKGTYVPEFVRAGEAATRDAQPPQAAPVPCHRRRAPRILVMPFEQEGTNDAFPGFARAFTRQIIVGLTRFDNVHVYGAETSEILAQRSSADQVAHQLPVDFILSGVVSLSQGSFAVDLLLQEKDTLRYAWTEGFSRKLTPDDVHVLRDEVAAIVAQRLAQPYGVLFSRALDDEGNSPGTMDGYKAVVEYYQYVRTFQRDRLEPTRRKLEQAIEQDPTFAEGYACLSQVHSGYARFMSKSPGDLRQHSERALALARQALILAPNSSNAHYALGVASWFAGDTTRSLESYRTAHALNPADTNIMADMGLRYCILMDWEQGVPLIEESYRRNPCQSSLFRMGLALYHFSEGQFEEGLRQAVLQAAPDVIYSHVVLAACAVRLGRRETAQEAISSILRLEPDYAQRVVFDLGARNLHPALAQDLILALREAGLDQVQHPGRTRRT